MLQATFQLNWNDEVAEPPSRFTFRSAPLLSPTFIPFLSFFGEKKARGQLLPARNCRARGNSVKYARVEINETLNYRGKMGDSSEYE